MRKHLLFLPVALFLIIFGVVTPAMADNTTPFFVVIDAGHGGKDPGYMPSSKKYNKEKEINLRISKKLGAYINENLPGVRVIYTRTSDKYLSLDERVAIANRNGRNGVFISVHCNGSPRRSSKGTETHIHSREFSSSVRLGTLVEEEFRTRAKRNSRGIKTKEDRNHNLQVLAETMMPGVLIETGFLSNPSEEKFLNSDHGQTLVASAIFRAFRSYYYGKVPPSARPSEPAQPAMATAKEKPATTTASTETKKYRVQVLATSEPVKLSDSRFKGVTVQEFQTQGTFKYKYVVGEASTPEEARKLAKQLKKKGFEGAFVVSL